MIFANLGGSENRLFQRRLPISTPPNKRLPRPVSLDPAAEMCYCENMKNITVSLEDEVYRRARVKAAEMDTSVSALVKKYLVDLAGQETDFERRKRLQNELLATVKVHRFSAGDRLTRDEVHDRKVR